MRLSRRNFDAPPVVGMDALGLVSKEHDLGTDGEASLRSWSVQHEYLDHVLARLQLPRDPAAFASLGNPLASKDGDQAVFSFRKLREGIVASGRTDEFAVTVYEMSVRVCLWAGNYAELFKSLVFLVTVLYPATARSQVTQSQQESPALASQAEMTGLYILHLVCSPSGSGSATAANAEQQPEASSGKSRPKCHGETRAIQRAFEQLPPSIRKTPDVQFAMRTLAALRCDADYLALSRQWNAASANQRLLLATILPRVRQHIVKILARAFFTYPEHLLIKYLCLQDAADLGPVLDSTLSTRVHRDVQNGIVPLRPPPGQARSTAARAGALTT
ncbi:hypothetical protein BC831DRAFT_508548 [Entophlyctis helioformis]|nr:hypothetical protein BC831DRAFT_508548 [Entophlyctis helioformis]